jgi:hypothetical protein
MLTIDGLNTSGFICVELSAFVEHNNTKTAAETGPDIGHQVCRCRPVEAVRGQFIQWLIIFGKCPGNNLKLAQRSIRNANLPVCFGQIERPPGTAHRQWCSRHAVARHLLGRPDASVNIDHDYFVSQFNDRFNAWFNAVFAAKILDI